MNKRRLALMAASAMLMASTYYDTVYNIDTPTLTKKETPKRNLPRWDVNGHIIFAKDEKTAEKYAKKRGLWVPGTIVKPIESK